MVEAEGGRLSTAAAAAGPLSAAGGAADVDPDDEAGVCGGLFRGLVFYLGREVPREALLLVIRSFGGAVGWQGEGSPIEESDKSITHQVRAAVGFDVRGSIESSRDADAALRSIRSQI